MPRNHSPRCRDFIVSTDGLVFSVVSYLHPKDRVIAFLRFIPRGGRLVKAGSTEESFSLLKKNHPEYVFHSKIHDTLMQAVPSDKISEVIRTDSFMKKLREEKKPGTHEQKIIELAETLSLRSGVPIEKFGVTGSVLVGAHNSSSDIDLVVCGRENFDCTRAVVAAAEPPVGGLDEDTLKDAYAKRFPFSRELSFGEFCFHELRKHSSGVFCGRKFDVLYVRGVGEVSGVYGDEFFRRVGAASVTAEVADDSLAFDYPAVYGVSGGCTVNGRAYKVSDIASFTHTYVGQVFKGEVAQAQGILEEASSSNGKRFRLLVGSSREAGGEYVKAVK